MPSPFPGMDPYIEDAEIWRGFHQSFAVELVGLLNPVVGPKYFADVEVRMVSEEINIAAVGDMIADAALVNRIQKTPSSVVGTSRSAVAIPEAPVRRTIASPERTRLRAVKIVRTETGQLVTSIEILSPYNKRPGEGIFEYRKKRGRILRSSVHLIEIDLVRGGERPGSEVNEPPLDADYVILVNRADESDIRTSEIWPLVLSDPLPVIPVPLLDPDPDVPLDLADAFRAVYRRAGYDWRIDYKKRVPPPELRPAMATWLRETHTGIGG